MNDATKVLNNPLILLLIMSV